ncbi:hypothetical protein ACOMHN_015147 [Nucella lapillus]
MDLQGWRVSFLFLFASTTAASSAVRSENGRANTSNIQSFPPQTHSPIPSNHTETQMTSVSSIDVFLPWNNPFNVISEQTYLTVKTIMFCYVSSGLFLIGVSSNFINCVVFYRQGLRERMNLCLFCLALVDLLFVTLLYTLSTHCVIGYFDPGTAKWWNFFFRKYFTGLYRGFLISSGCLTALIALERCVCVVLPLKAASLLRTRTMAALIAGIVGLIQLAAVLYPLQLDFVTQTDPQTGETRLFPSSTQFYARHKLLYTIVEDTILMAVIPFGTFIVVVISTIVTVLELNLRSRWRQLSSSSDGAATRQQVKLVKMLVVVSCIYIVASAPNVALGLARSLVPEFRPSRRYANIFLSTHLSNDILAMTNSSVNFFVYVTMSTRFRGHLFAILRCQPAPRHQTSEDVSGVKSEAKKSLRGV